MHMNPDRERLLKLAEAEDKAGDVSVGCDQSGFGIFPEHAPQYGAVDTYRIAAGWLDGYGAVYDWGCGKGFSRQFFERSQWVGIDGTFGDQVDLVEWRTPCDCILLRHVLENNPGCWKPILENALALFQRRMAVVTFTQWADETHVYKTEAVGGAHRLGYLRFRKQDLTDLMGSLLVGELGVQTTHSEHVFFLQK